MKAERRATLAGAVAVLAAANVLNNRLAPRLAPLTSAAATGVLLALARRSGLSWSELGFHRRSRGLRIGGALASAVAAVYGAGIAIPATRRFFRDERALSLSRSRALEEALLQVPIGTVLLEEVGFRGVLHALLARSYGPRTAVAVSSALFGLWHVLPAIDMTAANPALSGLVSVETPGDGDVPCGGSRGGVPRGDSGGVPRDDGSRGDGGGVSRGDGPPQDPPAEDSLWGMSRVVAGSVAATGLAGVFFCELRRRGGLAAPALLHVATNSLGYLFARLAPADPARPGDRRTAA
ncbi:CPBP family intramembrane glutamic endopeptidase [Streptosporangium sp. NBC_01756]|uniref:CPBP family intramembrane glutamic endopeptidase n=1 Tax=Streptosporangium sp. NBC_01756 TaxID=2975950 RepID=UPI002DDB2022|nr:type II CAAX endopeptidase family protein [Streptosporangium sp. NBC_01756]WSC83631.1 CPBP family intramembrane metalloprotease [Streptosporangium sp. NBC_01756]